MFFLFILLFLSGSYIYWKYTSAYDKKAFFSSAFFLSIAGSLTLIIAGLFIVNNFTPLGSDGGEEIAAIEGIHLQDTTHSATVDTTYSTLHSQPNPTTHYKLITGLALGNIDELVTLEKHYSKFIQESDQTSNSIGHFGLGVLLMKSEKYADALEQFSNITNKDLPYVHYCQALCLVKTNQLKQAEENYWAELHIKDGNFTESFSTLLKEYETKKNFSMIKKLMDEFPDHNLIRASIIRLTLLHEGDIPEYFVSVLSTISLTAKSWGVLAAAVISLIWMFYLLQLSIFRKIDKISPFLVFLGGCLCVAVIFLFNDYKDLVTEISLTGEFFHDLFYAIFLIGVPEEFVKILPLIIFLLFSKVKEPIEYIIYACASALGFAFIENILYFQQTGTSIIHGRAYLSVIGHMVDSSIIVYAFVLYRYKKKKLPFVLLFMITFIAGSVAHGIYDFLLFQGLIKTFFVFFIFIVQIWIIMINNCLNNSPQFRYSKADYSKGIYVYITLSLTVIFVLEYLITGFDLGSRHANYQFYGNFAFAGFSIIFFSSNLSSFNLVKGYWRDIYFSSREKRGYGTLPPRTLFTAWYFVNSIRAHNYVGKPVVLKNDPYNRILAEVLDQAYEGKLIDRIILYEGKDPDPHWFLLELKQSIPFENPVMHALVKLRNQEDSLIDDEYVQVFFRTVNDPSQLSKPAPQKNDFPTFGWARLHSNQN